jgi:hypothetical protein
MPVRQAVIAGRFVRVSRGIRVKFHAGLCGLEALRESWERVLRQHARPRFFHEWGWYQAYLQHLDAYPERVCFALLTRAADPIAIVPMQRVPISFHGLSSELWRLPEHEELPLADIVAADGVSGREIVTAVLAGMHRRDVYWDRVQFTGFGDDSCLNCPQLTQALTTYRDILTTCEEVLCDRPWDAFARRFSPNFRSNLNKARHKLERAGGASYDFVNDRAGVVALFPEFLRLEASGWKGAAGAGTAVALEKTLVGFYQTLIDSFAPRGRVYINVMRFGGSLIAAQLCITDSDTLYVLKQGYDEQYAQLAPGNSLLEQLVRWCHVTGRFRAINQAGRPRWFQDWKPTHSSNVYRLHCFNSTPVGQIHRFEHAARARLRAVQASLQAPLQ